MNSQDLIAVKLDGAASLFRAARVCVAFEQIHRIENGIQVVRTHVGDQLRRLFRRAQRMHPDRLDRAADIMRRRIVGEAPEDRYERLIARFVILRVCHAQRRFRCNAARVQDLGIADMLVKARLSFVRQRINIAAADGNVNAVTLKACGKITDCFLGIRKARKGLVRDKLNFMHAQRIQFLTQRPRGIGCDVVTSYAQSHWHSSLIH